jgi:hypothetical protein
VPVVLRRRDGGIWGRRGGIFYGMRMCKGL